MLSFFQTSGDPINVQCIEAGSWQSGLPVDHSLINAARRWIYLRTTQMFPNVSRGCGFMANVTQTLDALKYMAENGFIHFRNKLKYDG